VIFSNCLLFPVNVQPYQKYVAFLICNSRILCRKIPKLIESNSKDVYSQAHSFFNENHSIASRPLSYVDTPEVQHSVPTAELTKADSRLISSLQSQPEHEQLCGHLKTILTSPWRINNEAEPEGVFSPFITKVSQHQFQCVFCSQEHSRSDRAVAHCRKHINHRPFSCHGSYCRDKRDGWYVHTV
jgi:hypothetical protein